MSDAPARAVLVGGTGLVGRAVADHAGDLPLTLLVRRAVDPLPGQRVAVADPADWPRLIAMERPRLLISCLGTTIRAAGSQAAFRAVDHDMVLAAARAAKEAGATHMIAVSSVGASAQSRNFYLRTKGEVEDGLRALGFERLDILRPGLLTGDRDGPKRAGEGLARLAAPLTDALLQGSLRRYRSISADIVARAIVALAGLRTPGQFVHENDAMRRLAD